MWPELLVRQMGGKELLLLRLGPTTVSQHVLHEEQKEGENDILGLTVSLILIILAQYWLKCSDI